MESCLSDCSADNDKESEIGTKRDGTFLYVCVHVCYTSLCVCPYITYILL